MAKDTEKGKDTQQDMHCILCGKSIDEVNKLIQGPPDVYICDECIHLCSDILDNLDEDDDYDDEYSNTKQESLSLTTLLKPKELKEKLDDYVIGQDEAKKQLCVAVYNHYKRVFSKQKTDIEVDKSNIFLLGSTGTGKTLLAKTLAKILDVPFAIADATTLTQAGYVGDDPENILLKLIQNADFDIERAQKGIIYIDEIDKICRKGDGPSITRDVSGEGVQQALLKIIEGTDASVPPQGGRKHPLEENIQINTKDILFICGGSFDGLEKIIQKRYGSNSIGFSTGDAKKYIEDKKDIFKDVKAEDLIKFGLIPEFVGRVPVIARLQKLDIDDMIKILTEPKNAIINQYKYLMELDGIKLEFDKGSLEYIANEVIKNNLGARGLRSLIETIMQEAMYELPSTPGTKKYRVTKKIAEQKLA